MFFTEMPLQVKNDDDIWSQLGAIVNGIDKKNEYVTLV